MNHLCGIVILGIKWMTISFNLSTKLYLFNLKSLLYKTNFFTAFWQKRDVTYQQPDVKFKGEYLFLAETNVNDQIITCSSFYQYNSYVESLDNCSSIKVIKNYKKNSFKKFFSSFATGTKITTKKPTFFS